MKSLSIILAAASLAAVAAPAAAKCICVTHHRVVHRVVRHSPVRHSRYRVIVHDVIRPVYVDRPVYPHYRPRPVVDEGRYIERGPWVGPPVHHHHHWRDDRWDGPVRYEYHRHDHDDWRRAAYVDRF